MDYPPVTESNKGLIARTLEEHPSKALTYGQLRTLVIANQQSWVIRAKVSPRRIIEEILDKTHLHRAEMKFPSRTEIRYIWGSVPLLELVQSLKPEGYFSHETAVKLQGLAERRFETLYLNHEQIAKRFDKPDLTQKEIKASFARPPRHSKNKARYEGVDIYILNSMGRGRLGVVQCCLDGGIDIKVTGIERTLIDIAVRPFYAGGVGKVLEAFSKAKGRISLELLGAILLELDFVYPYHQAIGFYLERSGACESEQLGSLMSLGVNVDFYLTYQMVNPEYCPKWQVYYPRDLLC